MEMILKLKVAMDQVKTKTLCFSRVHVLVCFSGANQYCKIIDIFFFFFFFFFLFLKFETKERLIRVNISKIISENTFIGDHFEFEGSYRSSKEKKALCFA